MYNYHILTHRNDAVYNTPHFFILSKGNNSGKPSNTPWVNSFVCISESEKESKILYWTAYFLFKNKSIHRLLRGSAIPFISIREYKKEFGTYHKHIEEVPKKFNKSALLLERLNKQKKYMQQYLSQLDMMMQSVASTKF
jgi:hypothetical protein